VLIVDTGPLVATADRADKDHEACRQLLITVHLDDQIDAPPATPG
jgi:predicted nucleic acid-binding protein